MRNTQLEVRVATLERQVAELTARLTGGNGDDTQETPFWPKAKPDWVEKVSGKITDVEGFDEVLRIGREWRSSQPPAEDVDI